MNTKAITANTTTMCARGKLLLRVVCWTVTSMQFARFDGKCTDEFLIVPWKLNLKCFQLFVDMLHTMIQLHANEFVINLLYCQLHIFFEDEVRKMHQWHKFSNHYLDINDKFWFGRLHVKCVQKSKSVCVYMYIQMYVFTNKQPVYKEKWLKLSRTTFNYV